MQTYHRVENRINRRVAMRYGSEDPLVLGYTQNYTAGGCMLLGRRPYAPGTRLRLRLENMQELIGEVVWLQKAPAHLVYSGVMHRMGIAFRNPKA